MPRRLKIKTHEMGDLELYLIYQYGEYWEDSWLALQGDPITELLTVVSKETMDHALVGWSKPLVMALGIPPEGALRKLPDPQCFSRKMCPFYNKRWCLPLSKNLPHCYGPASIDDFDARNLGGELVSLWREGVYVVLVQEEV